MNIHAKVAASTIGSGLGGALAILIVWVLGQFFQIVVPGNVADALTVFLGAVVALVTGYLTPSSASQGPQS